MEAGAEVANELYTELEEEVYHELEHFVADPTFAAALEGKPGKAGLLSRWSKGLGAGAGVHRTALEPSVNAQASPSCAGDASQGGGEGASTSSDAQQLDWVTVDKKDAVESIAFYIAACIVDLPEAQVLSPAQLQAALLEALRTLKRSRFQHACSWGRRVYRWGAVTYSAVQMYQNPWLMRALVTALWAASRISMRLML